MVASASSSFRPPGLLPASPLAEYAGPWNARLAAHLLRRAGFGGSPADVSQAAGSSMHAAVEGLIHFPSTASLPAPPALIDTDEGLRAIMNVAVPAMAPDPTASGAPDSGNAALLELRRARRQVRREQDRANVSWWLDRMLLSPARCKRR